MTNYRRIIRCGKENRAVADSLDTGTYWHRLKQKLKQERHEAVTFCHGLKLPDPKLGKGWVQFVPPPLKFRRLMEEREGDQLRRNT